MDNKLRAEKRATGLGRLMAYLAEGWEIEAREGDDYLHLVRVKTLPSVTTWADTQVLEEVIGPSVVERMEMCYPLPEEIN